MVTLNDLGTIIVTNTEVELAVQRLLFDEALCLDDRRWSDWLEHYTENAVFIMPAWANNSQLTANPDEQVQLIYLSSRAEMEDRVFRIESGTSMASTPAARTCHLVTNVMTTQIETFSIKARANWTVHTLTQAKRYLRSGYYNYILRREGDQLQIIHKHVTLLDHRIEGPIDIYNV